MLKQNGRTLQIVNKLHYNSTQLCSFPSFVMMYTWHTTVILPGASL